MVDRTMSNGLRTSPHRILTNEEIESIEALAKSIEIPSGVLKFNQGTQTGFSDKYRAIYGKGDVFPDNSSNVFRDKLSPCAFLAHEYYGHFMNHPSSFAVGDWHDEFRASYRAALDAPNLSDEDRRTLMLDAYDRAKEAGIKVEYNSKARKINSC